MIQFLSTDAAAAGAGAGSLITMILPMILVIGLMYVILYLPQKKQDKKDAAMRASIEIGDEVTTIGGIIGHVQAIKDDTFVLETTSDRVKLRMRRSAIASVQKLDMGGSADKDKAPAAKDNAKESKEAKELPAKDAKEKDKAPAKK